MRSVPRTLRRLRSTLPRHAAAGALAVLAITSLIVPTAGASSDEVVRAPSGVTYVTGGAGSEAVERLKGMEREFNLKLVFANTTGEFLSDVKVTIADAAGKTLLDTTSEGPLLMAKLPAGSYRIDANFGGRAQSRNVRLDAAKLTTAGFQWAAR